MEIDPNTPNQGSLLLEQVLSGLFVTFLARGQQLFFISRIGGLQGAFPVLQDGTVCSETYLGNTLDPVKVYLGKDIPGLKLIDGARITWDESGVKPE